MYRISHARHRFPLDIIGRAVWLYFRLALSFRDVEDLMAERGIEASSETPRCGTRKFVGLFAGKRFQSQGSAQRFPATHAAARNTFNDQSHLIRRSTSEPERNAVTAGA